MATSNRQLPGSWTSSPESPFHLLVRTPGTSLIQTEVHQKEMISHSPNAYNILYKNV